MALILLSISESKAASEYNTIDEKSTNFILKINSNEAIEEFLYQHLYSVKKTDEKLCLSPQSSSPTPLPITWTTLPYYMRLPDSQNNKHHVFLGTYSSDSAYIHGSSLLNMHHSYSGVLQVNQKKNLEPLNVSVISLKSFKEKMPYHSNIANSYIYSAYEQLIEYYRVL